MGLGNNVPEPINDAQFINGENESKKNMTAFNESSTAVVLFWQQYYLRLNAMFHRVETYFSGSIISLLVFPVGLIWLACIASILTIHYSHTIVLPSVYLANVFLMWLFVITELTILVAERTMIQVSMYQAAWKMAFHSMRGIDFTESCRGTYGKSGKLIWWILMAFRFSSVAMTYLGQWYSVDTDLGVFPCIWPAYNNASFQNFTVSTESVSGNMDFAQVYMYGMPMANGILAGYGNLCNLLASANLNRTEA
jgi:hypothetical protein